MSKYNNVNPQHYKVRGRERQGEDIRQTAERQTFAKAEERATRGKPRKTAARRRRVSR
jgi:hypothetical protein